LTDYVLLESAERQHQVRVVIHIAVPNSNNAVNIKWRDAVVGWVGSKAEPVGDMTSIVPISILPSGVQVSLDTGALYEWEGTVRFPSWLSNDNKLVVIENWVVINDAFEFVQMKSILEFYGKEGSV